MRDFAMRAFFNCHVLLTQGKQYVHQNLIFNKIMLDYRKGQIQR